MGHVLISGGTRGIGSAIAKKFLDNGYCVTCLYGRNDEAARFFLESNSSYKDYLCVLKCNISDSDDVNSAVSNAIKIFGDVDVLISNAGISLVGVSDMFGFSDYRKVMDTNFGGFFNLTHEIIPNMIHNKKGSIIAISSMWGQTGASCEALYSASKGAIDSYVKALAKELGPSGIRVNAVSPGVIKTDMLNCFSEEDLKELSEETPIGRIGEGEDIANAVYFLSTNESSFITGQVLGVNGGFLI